MDEIELKITEYVDAHRDEFIEMLRSLVKIPSVTGYEKKAQEFVKEKLAACGFGAEFLEPDIKKMFEMFPEVAQIPSIGEEGLDMPLMTEDKFTYEQLMASEYDRLKSYNDRPNIVATLKGKGNGRSLIVNGHIDTVPVGNRAAWTKDPFGAEICDGKLYGRGAVDMKGGIATMLGAAQIISDLQIPLSGDLIYETVVNEEHAGGGALGCVAAGITADAAIIAEPTGENSNVVLDGNGGGVYWEVRIKGKEAHAGSRWQDGKQFGVSANEKAAVIIGRLIELEKELNKEQTLMSLCVGKLHGGTYSTATAPECVINGVAYFSPLLGTGKDGIIKVKKLIKEAVLNTKDSWLESNPPSILFQHYDDAYLLPEDKRMIRNFVADAVSDVLGKPVVFSQLPGGCDARHFGNQAGIPAVVYGPGSIAQAHSTDEYIDIESYIECVKVLTVAIYRWCK